ncbi:hypothetical protein ACSLBF_16480 [Pseudoalteromonas sp. T1lg65]|uniref:hypothetical protein n=1 Tax=Pseudoalteromonas sp. T1lg65 TaxID=2077101 RepID=UPI003F7AD6E7
MRKLALAVVISSLCVFAHAADSKTIKESFSLDDATQLEIDFPVGKLDLEVYSGSNIEVEIIVNPGNKDSWFGNSTSVDDAKLETKRTAGELALAINNDDYDLTWHVRVPKSLSLDIEVGVGNIEISELQNSADIEVGVGNINITTHSSDFRSIELASGVGKTALKGFTGDDKRKSMVGSESFYSGQGQFIIDAESGVGNVKLRSR